MGSNPIWTAAGGGIIASGDSTLNPQITSAGIYTLTITNSANGCTNTAQDTVGSDYSTPAVVVGIPDTLSCQTTQIILDGSGSSSGANFSYTWTGPGVSGNPDSIATLANVAGTYTLTVFNLLNGCMADSTVTVPSDSSAVTANAIAPDTLDCLQNTILLSSAGSSNGPGIVIFGPVRTGRF
ncbi:MAG: hypothetical protein IPL65_10915 [Lewinellaceae bacterium]|nr:hypothetical protein [Lewinellaceae bacterium]